MAAAAAVVVMVMVMVMVVATNQRATLAAVPKDSRARS